MCTLAFYFQAFPHYPVVAQQIAMNLSIVLLPPRGNCGQLRGFTAGKTSSPAAPGSVLMSTASSLPFSIVTPAIRLTHAAARADPLS
jgi:hypothetical protein